MNPAFHPRAEAQVTLASVPQVPRLVARALTAAGDLLAALGSRGTSAVVPAWIDPLTGLYNRTGFLHAGDTLLQHALLNEIPATLIVLDFADLVEVREIYGRDTSHKLQGRVLRKVKALAGSRGLVARTGKTEFSVLLPGAGAAQAEAVVQRQLGKPSRIELDAGHSEIVVVPDIHYETAAADADDLDQVYRLAAAQLAQRRAREQRRQLHLQRERERHSRPMSLPASVY